MFEHFYKHLSLSWGTIVFFLGLRFMLRHADADFNNLLLNSVPPVDLTRVNIFSGHLSKYSAEVENDNTQKAAQFLS